MKLILLIASVAFSTTVFADQPGFDIVIVAGQSNASGTGFGDFSDSLASAEVDSRIFQIGRGPQTNLKLTPAEDRLDHWLMRDAQGGFFKGTGVGFGMAFARRYAIERLAPNRKVLIVPAAFGGTYAFQWDDRVGDVTPPSGVFDNTQLIDDLKLRTQTALAQPGQNRVVALLWHQGESDVMCTIGRCPAGFPNASAYVERLKIIFGLIRSTDVSHEFPIVVGHFVPAWIEAISESWRGEAVMADYLAALSKISQNVPRSTCVQTHGLSSNQDVVGGRDTIHFSAQAQIELGARYFEAYRLMSEIASARR